MSYDHECVRKKIKITNKIKILFLKPLFQNPKTEHTLRRDNMNVLVIRMLSL